MCHNCCFFKSYRKENTKPSFQTKQIVKEKIRQTVQLISLDNKMTSETEVRAVASEVLSLVRPRLAGARFSDYWNTWLLNHAKDDASPLIYEFGCKDPAVVVATLKAYLLNICPLFLGSCFIPFEARWFRWAMFRKM